VSPIDAAIVRRKLGHIIDVAGAARSREGDVAPGVSPTGVGAKGCESASSRKRSRRCWTSTRTSSPRWATTTSAASWSLASWAFLGRAGRRARSGNDRRPLPALHPGDRGRAGQTRRV